jgi:hypothetical protein
MPFRRGTIAARISLNQRGSALVDEAQEAGPGGVHTGAHLLASRQEAFLRVERRA